MQIPPSGDFSKVNGITPSKSSGGNKGAQNEKIQRLREAINNGSYQVNVGKIASKIVDSGILNTDK